MRVVVVSTTSVVVSRAIHLTMAGHVLKQKSLVNRNKDSIWTSTTSKDITCKGIYIKCSCGGSVAGFVLYVLLYQIYPNRNYLMTVLWLYLSRDFSINRHIDPIREKVGYMCFIGSNIP